MLECGSAHFFLLGMQLSINEYSGAEVLLSGLAQLFVFVQDLYVEVVETSYSILLVVAVTGNMRWM